jgi:hypothetical protein
MPIKLTIEGGPLDGQTFEFGAEKQQVTIGRLPDRDVRFPADQNTISRAHLTIVQENARYFLRPDEPVFVNGEEGLPDDPLPTRCELTLGTQTGQKIRVEWHEGAEMLPTVVMGGRAGPRNVAREAQKAVQAAQRASRRLWVVAASVAALAIAGVAAFFLLQEEPIEARLATARKSVYLVGVRNNAGVEAGGGTAWVVGPGLLATNSHVVERFAFYRSRGAQMFVRQPEPPYRTFTVESVQMHPHYQTFAAAMRNYLPVRNNELMRFISGYDVALIKVAANADLGPPLPLADEATLRKLDAGDIVGFVGYPMERMTGGGTDVRAPNPQTQVGRLTAVTDYFLVRGDHANNHLVQHSLAATGGASGSPIFNKRGEVIALLSAGNVTVVQSGDDSFRIPLAVGVNFGQRVDLLVELMNGSAAARSAERLPVWQQQLAKYEHGPDVVARQLLTRLKAPNARPILDQTVMTGAKAGERTPVAEVPFRTSGPGTLLVMVFGPDAGKLLLYVQRDAAATTPAQPGGGQPGGLPGGLPGFPQPGGAPPAPAQPQVIASNDKGHTVPYAGADLREAIQGKVLLRAEHPNGRVRVRIWLVGQGG